MTDETVKEPEIIDLVPANFHIPSRAFVYEVRLPEESFFVSIVAQSSTDASTWLKSQLPPDTPVRYQFACKHIIQIS
jgi:hypothetical protein